MAKITNMILLLVFNIQKMMLQITYAVCKLVVKPEKDLWVVGIEEVANIVNNVSTVFEKVYSVNFLVHRFYGANHYNTNFGKMSPKMALVLRFVFGPILLGYLAARASNFFYVWESGFLFHRFDGRAYEFDFLKKRGKKIVTFFCGSDIRSPHLSIEHAKKLDIDVMATYQALSDPKFASPEFEARVRRTAEVADRYVDHIFNAPVDQIGYIKRDVHPFVYFYPDEKFNRNADKYNDVKRVKIVHAPSSFIIKGTQLIRAAIKKLKLQGYDFEYVEIINMPHAVVMHHLQTAHIVVNELYAFVPGIFGLEAMASYCAVLTSADREIETTLPIGANDAWMVTKYWEIYENLKKMLDDPALMRATAERGYEWAYANCRASVTRQYMKEILGA